MSQPNSDHDIIQLTDAAVLHLLPAYADEADLFEALDRCGLTQRQIFDELDRRFSSELQAGMNEFELAAHVCEVLFDAFDEAISDVTAHKAPLQ